MSNYNLNHTCLSGNLTSDPTLRKFGEGKTKVSFAIAVHEPCRGRDGAAATRTNYFEVVAWGSIAESTAKYTAKGDSVIVDGKLVQEIWEGKDGVKREKVRIEASRVCFNNPRRAPQDADGAAPAQDGGAPTAQPAEASAPRVDIGRPADDAVAVPF